MVRSQERLSALRAQRLLSQFGVQFAPAAVAGAIAAVHTGEPGAGVLVGISVLAVAAGLEQQRYPFHLMPLAGALARALAPLAGIALAFAVSTTLSPLGLPELFPSLLGAWVVLAVVLGVTALLARSLSVRIGVIGSPGLAHSLGRELALADMSQYCVAGWIDFTEQGLPLQADAPPGSGARRLGGLDRIEEIVASERIDLLVFGVRESEREANRDFGVSSIDVLEQVSAVCLGLQVRLIGATQLFEELFGHVALATMNAAWFQYMMHPRFKVTPPTGKRLLDIALGAVIGVLALPFLAVAAIAIKLEDGGRVIYRQRRLGDRGREFEVLKLRTMGEDAESAGAQWANANDARVTRVGGLLRRLHVDELPQIWNVLRGDMSVVGPRPERPELVAGLERDLPFYDRRQLVKPGLTGWAQIRCGYAGTDAGSAWKLAHDLYYLKRRSATLDLLILIETLVTPLRDMRKLARLPDDRFVLQALRDEG